ncbi:MAG: hypothetical protein JWM31_2600, partial [Solirubrobacterales bacterium]|nr:hypothetical protein [Solirubrobacterales bacterium]
FALVSCNTLINATGSLAPLLKGLIGSAPTCK